MWKIKRSIGNSVKFEKEIIIVTKTVASITKSNIKKIILWSGLKKIYCKGIKCSIVLWPALDEKVVIEK